MRKHKSAVAAFLLSSAMMLGPAQAQDAAATDLLDQLAQAEDARAADRLERQVRQEWSKSGSATIDLLLKRGQDALDVDNVDIEVQVRYQACTNDECLLPRTESFTLNLALDVVDTPSLGFHTGHGQREGAYDSTPAMRRLFLRKLKKNPLGLPKFIWKMIKLEFGARRRARENSQ